MYFFNFVSNFIQFYALLEFIVHLNILEMKKVIIIGNGIAGTTAARWIRKLSDYSIQIISDESDYFFSRTALMYVYMGHMRWQDIQVYEEHFWSNNKIELLNQTVIHINESDNSITLRNNTKLNYDILVIATGSKTKFYDWPGLQFKGISGLYFKSDLEYIEAHSPKINHAVIVGGGLIGIELAEMLITRGKQVTMLVREDSYWSNILPKEESKMVSKHILQHHVEIKFGTELQEIFASESNEVSSIKLSSGEIINCEYIGIATGVSPNIECLKHTNVKTNKGILVDKNLRTNVKNIYAVGDCAELQFTDDGRKAIEAVWYSGRMMGEVVAHNICGIEMEYEQGIWFNSAKFFDIEYQVYGYVPAKAVEGVESVFWQHEREDKSIRIVFDSRSKIVIGFNLMGVRFRHEVCDKWIQDKIELVEVVQDISLAFFDPEFSRNYSSNIVDVYNAKFNTKIRAKVNSLNSVLHFLKIKA